ncbi:helix-turn-helix domain-containing protein [Microbacterium sp. zg-Y818]|uniref:helix-turn-helix domain-containing protein n=1 Tax=unclassified Microbacterium TaxID=2609290 RepID=UPI00214B32C8|nr:MULTISPECIES: helix-turn-helix domain-containing protein [unclassified Microbacterium]MCR2800217.1 helix-turn-helix domain-containing protein [Microbacterium sp. zg.Y818]WIM22184.1 helix-turn-helix domain-containing protein [Microbacterium sp. zg-Y818]
MMSTAMLEVVTPAPTDRAKVAQVLSFLDAHQSRGGAAPTPAFYLSGPNEHDRVELNEQLFRILKDVAGALSRGQSVSIIARDKEISTQQAADILGISRPTVVKLIGQGDLHATVPGEKRRKLRLADVLEYRDRLHQARNEFITESSAEFDDVDPADAAALAAKARRAR